MLPLKFILASMVHCSLNSLYITVQEVCMDNTNILLKAPQCCVVLVYIIFFTYLTKIASYLTLIISY